MNKDALGHVPVYIQNISGILCVLVCMKESGRFSLCVYMRVQVTDLHAFGYGASSWCLHRHICAWVYI